MWSILAHAATILVVGDSISAGFGIPLQQGWVSLAEQQLQQDYPQLTLINASISGDTTAGGRSRLPSLLEQHQPHLVIIELGGNDGLRGTPIQVIRSNLSAMVEHSQQLDADVLLLGMQIPPNYGAAYTQAFAKVFQQVSDSHDTRLVPFLLADIAGNSELMQSDGIHPTAEAQPVMATIVVNQIRDWLNRR